MATVAVYNVKGGVGKSTIAANLAWCSAALSGRNTLLWDLDPSGASGFLFGIEPAPRARSERLFHDFTGADELIWHTGYHGLDLLPADASLRMLDATLLRLGPRMRLPRLLERFGREYDRVIVDCPPVFNQVSAQLVRGVDAVVLPVTPSALSSRALEQIREDLARNHRGHAPVLPVLSMVDMRRTLHRQAVADNPTWPVIPMASALERTATHQAPVGVVARGSPAAEAFARLWSGIERKLTGAAPSKRDKALETA